MSKIHFTDLVEQHKFLGIEPPEHPLFSIVEVSSSNGEAATCTTHDLTLSSDFYSISFKHITSGEIHYGRTKYDCKNGTMLFTAPEQEIRITDVKVVSTGRSINFHPDFIRGHSIKEELRKYNFFSYAVNEALHLSPKEEKLIAGLFEQIESEYHNNQDEFSKELILAHLSTLLKYANRFYHRQFLHRKESASNLLDTYQQCIDAYIDTEDGFSKIVPSIEQLADDMNMTPRYLSDALKAETGKTAMENLHLHLIDKAKDLLLKSDETVATVAYALGFEYPQYFARLFKKKTGMTPTEYRKLKAI